MKVSYPFFIIILSFLVISCSKNSNNPVIPSNVIKIGSIYNLTGSQASLDSMSLIGAQFAVKQINDNGGINGKTVQLINYDGMSDTNMIKTLTDKLINKDSVTAIIGFSDSDMLTAALNVCMQYDKLIVTSGATSPVLPGEYPGKLFLACFGDNTQAAAAAEYSYNVLGYRNCYVLFDNDMLYTTSLSKYFKERFTELGGLIAIEDIYNGSQSDYSQFINNYKILLPKPDMLFIAAGPNDCGKIIKAFRQAGINEPIFGGDSYDSQTLLDDAGSSATNIYFTTHAYLGSDNTYAVVKDFLIKFNQYNSTIKPNAFTALGYDAVNILANGMKTANILSTDFIKNAIFNISDFPAVTGNITYGQDTYIPKKYVTLMKITNSKVNFINAILPVKVPVP